MIDRLKLYLILIGIGAALGMTAEWFILKPKETAERPAPEKRQADNSLILERKPDPTAKPAHEIPKGATVERIVKLTVKPERTEASAEPDQPIEESVKPAGQPRVPLSDCPPVDVDLSLIREKDGGHRVIASSPDGTVTGGLDIPVTPEKLPKALPWAVGGYYNPVDRSAGGFLERDLGPFRVGADLGIARAFALNRDRLSVDARVRLGIRF